MQTITRENLQTMMDRGDDFALVDVLPARSFDEAHLPGATNIPIERDFAERVLRHAPDKDQPVVVYSRDHDCSLSRRAAETLDELGYHVVYEYAGGKADWKRAALPLAASG